MRARLNEFLRSLPFNMMLSGPFYFVCFSYHAINIGRDITPIENFVRLSHWFTYRFDKFNERGLLINSIGAP